MEEPVVGPSEVQIVLGKIVGVVRSVESQFVVEPVVGQLVVFGKWTGFGRWIGSGGRVMPWVSCMSSVL